MIELQLLNKVLQDGNIDILVNNGIDHNYFTQFKDEYTFIINHYNKYNKMPDKETISTNNSLQFEFFDVNESNEYLINAIKEEQLFNQTVGIIHTLSDLLSEDSFKAVEYLNSVLPKLSAPTTISGTNIMQDISRLDDIISKKDGVSQIIKTGLKELDDIIYGWLPGEELVTIFARLGQGKTWTLLFFLIGAWKQGKRVGVYSGEMSPDMVGFRIDTLINNFSNKQLIGGTLEDVDKYKEHLQNLQQQENPFFVLTPKHLGGRATVSQLRQFVKNNGIELLGIDQYSLLADERATKSSSPREQLEHISTDLFDLSVELGIPIIVLSQANRGGARKDEDGGGTPDVENIYGADAIGQNATRIIALRQTGAGLELSIKKNRYGTFGQSLLYYWDIDGGIIKYIPNKHDVENNPNRISDIRNRFNDARDVF